MTVSIATVRVLFVATLTLAGCASTPCEPPDERRAGRAAARGAAPAPVAGGGAAGLRGRMLGEYAAQLADTGQRLNLTPAQAAAWERYAAKAQALMADQLRAPTIVTQDNALQAIERRVDVVRNRYAAIEDVADAARGLYAQLDEQQKLLADRLLPPTVPALYSGLGERPVEREPARRLEMPRDERGPPR